MIIASTKTWIKSMAALHSKTHKTLLTRLQTMAWSPIILPSKRANICWITNHRCTRFPLCLNISGVSPQLTSSLTSFSLARAIKTSMTRLWASGRKSTIRAAIESSLGVLVLVTATLSITKRWMLTPLSTKTSLQCLIPSKCTCLEKESIGCIR